MEDIEKDRDLRCERYFDDEPKEGEYHPAKRQCLEMEKNPLKEINVEQDPFKLPETCVDNIFKYLSGKELLLAREISRNWRQKVEENDMIMKRAMKQVVARFDDYSKIGDIGSETPPKRAYENMKAFYPQYSALSDGQLFPLIGHYASSLVDLKLECVIYCLYGREKHDYNNMQPITFPKLKKLQLDCRMNGHPCAALAKFILSCSFPEVKETIITCKIFKGDGFSKLFPNLPKLEVMFLQNLEDINIRADPEVIFPKVSCLTLFVHSQSIFETFKESLTALHIFCYLSTSDLAHILRLIPNLSCLIIGSYGMYDLGEQLTVHNNLQTLQIKDCNRNDLHQHIAVFPNLEDLLIPSIDEAMVHWLASNMIQLKKLESYEITDEAREAYARLREDNENRYINTAFELEILQKRPRLF